MNQQLLDLYTSHWKGLKPQVKQILDDETLEVKPTNPLLIFIDDENDFKSADIRIMIFGQETNDWGSEMDISDESITARLEGYDTFFNSGYCFSYGGQFWNGVNRFIALLEEKYPQKKIRFVWNNIVKIGKDDDKGCPPEYIYNIERENFSVIKREIEIIEPNFILFFTGPNYDDVIEDVFGKLQYTAISTDSYTKRQISQVSIPNIAVSFRTYHPNYLWRNNIDDYLRTIIKETTF